MVVMMMWRAIVSPVRATFPFMMAILFAPAFPLVPASFMFAVALPRLMTLPLFMAPPAMFIILVAVVPPARFAPVPAIPVIAATVAFSQL